MNEQPKRVSRSNLKIVLIVLGLVVLLCIGSSLLPRIRGPVEPRVTMPSSSGASADSLLSSINNGLEVVGCSKDSFGYATVSGTLKNLTSSTLIFVQVKVMLQDSGAVVDTDSTYAVGDEGLAPGESTTWEWMFSDAPSFGQCNAEVFDYKTR